MLSGWGTAVQHLAARCLHLGLPRFQCGYTKRRPAVSADKPDRCRAHKGALWRRRRPSETAADGTRCRRRPIFTFLQMLSLAH